MSVEKNPSHTLLDNIVQETLTGIALAQGTVPMMVHGSIAAQIYLPRRQHRPTRDLDLACAQEMRYGNFQQVLEPTSTWLQERGYRLTSIKGRRMYCLVIGNDTDTFKIQMPRRNGSSFIEYGQRNQHAFENAEDMQTANGPIKVIRPEDLILHKMQRVYYHEREYGLEPRPWSYNEHKLINTIKSFRTPLLRAEKTIPTQMLNEPRWRRLVATIKVQTDLHDTISLLKNTKINWQYLCDALVAYPETQKQPERTLALLRRFSCRRDDALPADFF
jgi:hypothetical protein